MSDDGTPNEPGPNEPGFDDPGQPPWGESPGTPQHGHPPQQGYPPQQDQPPQGYPPQGYPPQQGYPQQGFPQQGYPPQGQPPPGYGPAPAYGQPGFAAYGVPAPATGASQNANVALGLSVGGLATYVVGFCCGPLALIGLALCGTGAFMGWRELKAIDSGQSSEAGRNSAKAAMITGGIGVGLFAIGIVLVAVFFSASLVT